MHEKYDFRISTCFTFEGHCCTRNTLTKSTWATRNIFVYASVYIKLGGCNGMHIRLDIARWSLRSLFLRGV